MRLCLAALATLAALTAPVAWAGEFTYAIPTGWQDLRRGIGGNDIPPELVAQASNPRYVAVAVDPSTTTRTRIGATFNAVETQTTGHVTPELARTVGQGIVAELSRAGVNPTLVDAGVEDFNGVTFGVLTLDARGTNATVYRMRQYIVPGHNMGTVLSYSAPRDDFDRLVPAFEESARGLKGAYDPGVFHMGEFVRNTLYVTLVLMVLGAVLKLARRRNGTVQGEEHDADAASAQAKARTRAAAKHVWFCADCDNPVPLRLEQCRCGGRKPA
jgi:hypothetical protein